MGQHIEKRSDKPELIEHDTAVRSFQACSSESLATAFRQSLYLGHVTIGMSTASIIEFLLWLVIAASVIALVAKHLRMPYTVALVAGGFAIDLFRLPITTVLGHAEGSQLLTPDIILILFLPALLFESGININVRQLRENFAPILLLAIVGVILATAITGYAMHWAIGLALVPALLFGALISATDPISVVALFKDLGVSKRLSVILESASLFNDGTSVVVFQIILAES